jgi:hypothetical protein
VEEFFAEVEAREHEPFLRRISGTIRFDLTSGSNGTRNGAEHWTVAIDKGDLSVSRRNGKADTVIRTDRKLFERIITGQANAMASLLRGVAFVEGDPELGVLSDRLVATAGMRRPRRV